MPGHQEIFTWRWCNKSWSETWVLTPRMQRACSLTGRKTRKGWDGVWVYPPLEDAMAEAGLQEVETYISCRHNTVEQYITTRPIMDLCLAAKLRPGTRVEMWWWEHEGLDLEGMRTADREAEQTEGGEKTDGTETATDG